MALRVLFDKVADFREAQIQDGGFWFDRWERFEATLDVFGLRCFEWVFESTFEGAGLGCWLVWRMAIGLMAWNLNLVINRLELLILLVLLILVLVLVLAIGLRSALEFGSLEKLGL